MLGQSWAGGTALPRLFTSGWNGRWLTSLQNNQRVSGCVKTPQDTRALTSTNLQPSRRSHTPACMLVTSTANMSTGVTAKHPLTVRAWTFEQQPTTSGCCTSQREQPASPLIDETLAPTRTWPLRVLARTADCRTDVFWESSRSHITYPGCRHGRSTVDQVTLLTQDIEDSFSAKKKGGAVFVDLTAAYDTVRHLKLTCKLLRLLHDRHMVRMIMEMAGNRSNTNGERLWFNFANMVTNLWAGIQCLDSGA